MLLLYFTEKSAKQWRYSNILCAFNPEIVGLNSCTKSYNANFALQHKFYSHFFPVLTLIRLLKYDEESGLNEMFLSFALCVMLIWILFEWCKYFYYGYHCLHYNRVTTGRTLQAYLHSRDVRVLGWVWSLLLILRLFCFPTLRPPFCYVSHQDSGSS